MDIEINENLRPQTGWIYDSTKQNIIEPCYDALSIYDFDLYVAVLRTYIAQFWHIENCDFYVNRLRKRFHIKIPMYGGDLGKDNPMFYVGTENKKDIQNFQNLLNFYFGIFDEHPKAKRIFLDILKRLFKNFKTDRSFSLMNSLKDGWPETFDNLCYLINAKMIPRPEEQILNVLQDIYRMLEYCDFKDL